MKKFYYKGINEIGENISGYIDSENKQQAINTLKLRNIRILHISSFYFTLKSKLKDKDICFFANQLYFIISSGIDLEKALGILEDNTKGLLKEKVIKIRENIFLGMTFNQGVEEVGFPKFFCHLISIGETSGKLEDVLKRLGEYYNNKRGMKESILNSLLYPAIVMLFLCVAVFFSIIFILPNYLEIFKSYDVDLPKATLILMEFSDFFRANFILLFLTLIGVCICFLFINDRFKYYLHGFYLKIPIIKDFITLDFNYFLCDTISLMLNSGITFISSMKEIEKLYSNKKLCKILQETVSNLESGIPIELSFANNHYSQMTKTSIQIGMESGKLEESLKRIGINYKREINLSIKRLEKLIEIGVTLVIGLVLGFVMIALILPSFYIVNLI